MPIPFIVAGAALAAGAFGVKKGLDAKKDYEDAEYYNNRAKEIFEEAQYYLERQRENTENSICNLGFIKAHAYQDCIIPFVQTFEKIKKINFQNNLALDGYLPTVSSSDFTEIKNIATQMTDVLSAGVQGLGAGALAGLGALGGVTHLATASTGTAIASLSGAAASNATLAWLGGGSLASGGLGVAGGTAVLGGLVAGPVLAVGGLIMANKAEAAKENALSNLGEAEYAAEQMNIARARARNIQYRADDMYAAINQLINVFKPLLESFQQLVEQQQNYEHFSENNKKGVMIVVSIAKALKALLETPIMDSNGSLTNVQELLQMNESIIESAEDNLTYLNYEYVEIKKPSLIDKIKSLFSKS